MKQPKPIRSISGDLYDVFKVVEDLDKNEGRGGTSVVGYYHDKADADEAAKDKGVFGSPGRIDVMQMLSIDGGRTGYVFNVGQAIKAVLPGHKALRAAGLAKLTADEREALGL